MLLALGYILAAAASVQPVATGGSSLQQNFDTASDAAQSGDCATAVPLFEALERNPKIKPGSLPAAAIAVRKGLCYIKLDRSTEAEELILAALPTLEREGANFALDIEESYIALGDISMARWEYAEARQRYEKALSLQTGKSRIGTLVRLSRVTAFDQGPEPLSFAEEAIRIISAQEKPSKDLLASLHAVHARTLLNRGQTQEAYAELKQALSLSGGLTRRTTLDEASLRGDLALAALLLGYKDEARRYLAYSGAGRIIESPFATAEAMAPPDCGEETGLKPDDFAVVEFSIGNDGSVMSAQTTYSRGGPNVATAFSRALKDWYWQPEALAKLPVFYRLATRVELRCSTGSDGAPSLMNPLYDRFRIWAETNSLAKPDSPDSRARYIDNLRSILAEKEKAGDVRGQIATIGLLAVTDPRRNAAMLAMLDRAIGLTGQTAIPDEVVNALRILRLQLSPYARMQGANPSINPLKPNDFLSLASEPAMASDPLASDSLRLFAAIWPRVSEEPRNAVELLQQVADDKRLPDHHPLRQLALLKLANRAATSGDLTAAQSLFAKTGLTEQQCALIGARPALKNDGVTSNKYPMAALEYGFEGWVKLEFDIQANGKAANARALIAYPPFVFVDAATGMTKGFRYEASYRPEGNVACSANRENIRFIIPELRQ